jgi:hypothetical protein
MSVADNTSTEDAKKIVDRGLTKDVRQHNGGTLIEYRFAGLPNILCHYFVADIKSIDADSFFRRDAIHQFAKRISP